MLKESLKTPVLLIAFNRPELTRRVLDQIRKVKPEKLYLAVDGPRKGKSDDTEKCEDVKKLAEQINWPCEVKTLFSDKNLGCKLGPYSAIKWFFENVKEGIILEDDVLPDVSFFYFCQDLLNYYRDDARIGTISGNNFQEGMEINDSYCFSIYSQTWGWATWRRVWKKYDVDIKKWPELKNKKWLKSILKKPLARFYWRLIFDAVYSKKINSAWDYQWTFVSFFENFLTIIPGVNLATNIGIGDIGATHTKRKNRLSLINSKEIIFPLIHPKSVSTNTLLDKMIQKKTYVLWKEIGARIAKWLGVKA
jgi:hypothetical protein